MRCVSARNLVPLALTCVYALWTFWPDRASVPGWGGDPLFVLWIFEEAWRQMDRLGPLHLWSDRFWTAPIFAGMPLQLACSENRFYPAVVLRPLRRLLEGPVRWEGRGLLRSWAAFGGRCGGLRATAVRNSAAA